MHYDYLIVGSDLLSNFRNKIVPHSLEKHHKSQIILQQIADFLELHNTQFPFTKCSILKYKIFKTRS